MIGEESPSKFGASVAFTGTSNYDKKYAKHIRKDLAKANQDRDRDIEAMRANLRLMEEE